MHTFLTIFEITVSILLIIAILLQEKGVGLSSTFGGESEVYTTKRGADKFLYRGTVLLAVLFFGGAIAFVVV